MLAGFYFLFLLGVIRSVILNTTATSRSKRANNELTLELFKTILNVYKFST